MLHEFVLSKIMESSIFIVKEITAFTWRFFQNTKNHKHIKSATVNINSDHHSLKLHLTKLYTIYCQF